VRTEAYSGIGKLGHTMYDPVDLEAELAVQRGVTAGDIASCQRFKDFVVNVQQFREYLEMLGGKHIVTMMHTPGAYYSISSATRHRQLTSHQGAHPGGPPYNKNMGMVHRNRGSGFHHV
jgi:hypothetical protein